MAMKVMKAITPCRGCVCSMCGKGIAGGREVSIAVRWKGVWIDRNGSPANQFDEHAEVPRVVWSGATASVVIELHEDDARGPVLEGYFLTGKTDVSVYHDNCLNPAPREISGGRGGNGTGRRQR
jgi:hypothetical protein